jgi:formate dehydrogenase gamma subunit
MIVVVIGGMVVHNVLLFGKKVRARLKAADLTVVRMDASQRLQHFLLAFSFIYLAVSGFALKWPDSWVARILGSSEQFRSWSHRIAGVILLVVGAYHIYYLLAKREGRRLLKDMLPTTSDASALGQMSGYLVGARAEKPKIGRFGYAEKMEYWAVVWGTIIMGVTGFMIWFKMPVTQFLPRWAVDVALTIHYYEAILACLAIVVWHFYHVIFDPDVYPLNWACLNGKVTRHWHEDEHPLDRSAEGLSNGKPGKGQTAATPRPSSSQSSVRMHPHDR